jgi:hypothetical protein
MRDKPAKGDLVIARIAARQHGVVSAAQLRTAGLSREPYVAERRPAGCTAFIVGFTPSGTHG